MADKENSNASGDEVVSLHRRVSIEFLENTTGYAVKVPRGDKNPSRGWDPKNATDQKSQITRHEIQKDPTCNLGVHIFGTLVDVDIDSDSPALMAALNTFLPPCAHTWGRESRPRTHRLYSLKQDQTFDPSEFPVLKRIMKWPETKVEVRGGPQSRGEYSLLPGSIHPSGEEYQWTDLGRARNSITTVDIEQIMRAVRFAGTISVLAPHWIEGQRNDLAQCFAGFLYRIYSISPEDDPDPNQFVINKDTAERLFTALLKIAGDDEKDTQARMKTFHMTWKKAEGGAPVTGATRLAEITGDKDIVRKMYALLTDGQDMAVIDEFTSRYVIWQGPGLAVDLVATARGAARPFMTRQQFLNSHGDVWITKGDRRQQLADLFWSMSVTTRLAGVTFVPGDDVIVDTPEGKKVNQWSGFEVEPFQGKVSDDDVRIFLDYVFDVIADRDHKARDWVLDYVSHIFQTPAQKSKTALVLVGKPGAGKSFLGHSVIMPIVGPTRHAISASSVDAVVKGFNASYANKIFIQCDEATNNRQKASAAKLNAMVTDPYITIEPKGVDSYQSPNHARFLFTSNDENDAMFLGHGTEDRRYTILKVSHVHMNDPAYWDPMYEWFGITENLAKLHTWFRQRQIDWKFLQRPYVTKAKAEMSARSLDPYDQWLYALVTRDFPLHERIHQHPLDAIPSPSYSSQVLYRENWPKYVRWGTITDDYLYFCKSHGIRLWDPLNEQMLKRMMLDRGIGLEIDQEETHRKRVKIVDPRTNVVSSVNVRIRPFPPKEEIVAYLEQRVGIKIEVNNDTGDTDVEPDGTENAEF